jgi:type IV pilus assembly protein PilV
MTDKGFTLLELVVAILVFAVGILGIAKMQSLSVMGNSYGMHMSQAVNIAQDKLEELQDLSISSSTFGIGTPSIAPYTIKVDGVDYTIQYNVKQVAALGAREVEIEVQWADKGADSTARITFIKR